MRPTTRMLRLLAGMAAMACAIANAAGGSDAPPAAKAEPGVQPAPKVAVPPKVARAARDRIETIVLDAPAAKSLAAPASSGAPLQVGFGRSVDPLADTAKTAQHLHWDSLPGGARVAAISVRSTGAKAIRAGLAVESLPPEAVLRFYAPAGGEVFEATGRDILETIARNVAGGDRSSDAYTYWSPVIDGEEIVVEVEIPAGTAEEEVRLAAPMVSHLVASSATGFDMPKASSSCENDVMCYTSEWGAASDAVARIVYTNGGSSFLCSATLLADLDPSTTVPYLLTANHCVGSQSSASSLQSYWFYRSSACNSGVLGNARTLAGGATLLYATANTDTSFMRLNGAPPAGAGYTGWIASGAAAGSGTTGIHHPGGDMQKISMGSVAAYASCFSTGGDTFSCNGATSSTSTFYVVKWASGITEPGSSGSGLLLDNGHYLVGQLYGGSSQCGGGGSDAYGRFDVAYNNALYQWLGGTPASTGSTGGGTPTPTPPPSPSYLPTVNYTDLWWNPNESGWGIDITQHADGQLFAAWYVYDTSGNPSWLVVPGGTWSSPTTFRGDLYTTTGPPQPGPWSPIESTRVGTATLTFSGSDQATLAYTVNGVQGTKQIQRQAFGAVDTTPVANYADLWWNQNESGWGLSITQHYRSLFAVWYTYDRYGGSTWLVMPSGSWTSADTYGGTLYRTTAAPVLFYGTAFDPSRLTATPAGTLTLQFTGANSALMTATVGGVTTVEVISRQSF